MGQEYSWEVRERAEELYIVEGQTFEQVAQVTGVSISQLKRWSEADGWPKRKREYRQALNGIKRDTVALRQRLVAQALQSLNPQDIYAMVRLESLAARIKGRVLEEAAPVPENLEPRCPIRTPQDAVSALEEVAERRLHGLLAQPEGLKLSVIKELKQALDLIGELKGKYHAGAEAQRGLTDAAVEEIRRKILGVCDA